MNPSLAELGARLREAREAKGVSLDVLSGQTRIHVRHLRALEEAREDLLPEPFYVKSFVRKAGDALGLDGADLARVYWEHRPAQAVTAPLEPTTIEVVMPWWIWPLMASAVLAAIVGTMAVTRPDGVQTLLGGTGGEPLQATASLAPVASPEPTGLATTDASADATATLVPGLSDQASPAIEATPLPVATPAPQAAAKPLRFGVRPVSASWMRIMADGQVVHEGMVPGGSDRQWGADRQLSVRIGQPGQVEGRLNDASLGRLGPPGSSVYAMAFRVTPQGIARNSLLQPTQAKPVVRPPQGAVVRPARPVPRPVRTEPAEVLPESSEPPVTGQDGQSAGTTETTPPAEGESP
ncbi:MAG: RodZ domain-containing protein [Candidatus Sericytochromatia bacterium]|nr:RodZ domain-containing protein [Candidatus Sericytochromatia bacterium]